MQIVDNFRDSLSSEHTKFQYTYHLNRYFKTQPIGSNPESITRNIVNYLVSMKNDEGLSYPYRRTALSAIKHYYTMNDVLLNWIKIAKFLGEMELKYENRGYTHEEIKKLLDVADIKYRAVILTLASTAMRRAALVNIELNDMMYLEDYRLYKIKIYKRTKYEQVCFTTPEAAEAIDIWLENKDRIRDRVYFHHIDQQTLSEILRKLAVKAGVAQHHHMTESSKLGEFRDSVPCVHGLRKFAATQMGLSDMKTEMREILLGHSIGVRASYQYYSDDDLLEEYLKAVNNLTINNEYRLQTELDILKAQQDEMTVLKKEIGELKAWISARS